MQNFYSEADVAFQKEVRGFLAARLPRDISETFFSYRRHSFDEMMRWHRMTADYDLGRYVKRVLVADMLSGSADFHGKRLARLIADETRADMTTQKETAA